MWENFFRHNARCFLRGRYARVLSMPFQILLRYALDLVWFMPGCAFRFDGGAVRDAGRLPFRAGITADRHKAGEVLGGPARIGGN
jgi:hypothetical protein